MFWRSVVGKLAVTILLLVSFVLVILTIFLLQFFENFHVQQAEEALIQTAERVTTLVEHEQDQTYIQDATERVKDLSSRVAIVSNDGNVWVSSSGDDSLPELENNWIKNEDRLMNVLTQDQPVQMQMALPGSEAEAMIVGRPAMNDGAVFVYQSLNIIRETRAETTKIILLAAGIAIILTTFFAVFLSTRITSPLLKMREAAHNLTHGEFNTKVPILTHDEIGELAVEFNRMGRQLKFHINALRQEKEQLSSIVSSMADGVVTLNRNGDMIVTNPPAVEFIENWYYESNLEIEKSQLKLPSDLFNVLQDIINGEQKVVREYSLQGRNYVMLMTPLYDQHYVRGAVAVIRDMTEERRLDKLRKDFVANVSHELRTPISMLQGYSEAIVDDIAESKDEKNELAEIIHEESLRMGRLVNELLDLARMEAGHMQLNLEPVDLEAYTERILKKFNGIADENQIKLKLTKDLHASHAIIDPDQIEQVFTNLIDNAIRHTNEQGYVHVTIHSTEKDINVSIADNGSGIPEEDLPFVFERFYKADKSRTKTTKKKGTGIGLAIAKNIIEAHGGTLRVKSKLNHGTTFSFHLSNQQSSEGFGTE